MIMCIVWFQVELDETNAFGISPDLVFTAEEELSGDNGVLSGSNKCKV